MIKESWLWIPGQQMRAAAALPEHQGKIKEDNWKRADANPK
jgi:hypothetical protein